MKITKKLAVATTALIGISTGAVALPAYDAEYLYFSDNTYTEQVGLKHVMCTGEVYKEGEITIYRQTVLKYSCRYW